MSASDIAQALSAFRREPRPVLLDCSIQHYAWGHRNFIPKLLAIDNPQGRPCAELWMGAHPDLPSRARLGNVAVALNELLEVVGDPILGSRVASAFRGQLPFLFKVLAAAAPLSIQVHPDRQSAREGFFREETAGIPLSARNRNYKDTNHKPELIAALTDFYGLRGFRPLPEIARTLDTIPELRGLAADFHPTSAGLKTLYGRLMTLPQQQVDAALEPLIERLDRQNHKQPFARDAREYWALRADGEHSRKGHRDRGLFSFFLLNLVHLRPTEAMYLPPRVLHSYLEGAGIEIMANSNNVLRGGLTPKHVDVPELLAQVSFEPAPAEILRGESVADRPEWVYRTPAEEFELRRIEIAGGQPYEPGSDHGVEILIVTNIAQGARITIHSNGPSLDIMKGQVSLVPDGVAYSIDAGARATLYKATVPPN